MPGVPQTLPVPPLVNEMTMLNAIRLAAEGGGGGASNALLLAGATASTLGSLTAATADTGGLLYGTQGGADRKFTLTAAGATLVEAANATAQRTALGLGTIATLSSSNPTLFGVTVANGSLTINGNISEAVWTTTGVRIKGTPGTLTDISGAGTVAAAYTNAFSGNTIAASNARTFTNYVTSYHTSPTAGTNVTFTQKWGLGTDLMLVNGDGAASQPALALTGTPFTGGTATTTKPLFSIEPTGTTSTGWSTSGTMLGVNCSSTFVGNLLDVQKNGVSRLSLSAAGVLTASSLIVGSGTYLNFVGAENYLGGLTYFRQSGGGVNTITIDASNASSTTQTIGWYVANVIKLALNYEADDVLSLKRTTNAQTFRVYGTTTGTKYASFAHNGTDAIISASAGLLSLDTRIKYNSGNTTGAGAALLGSNSPAATLTAPYTWITATSSDGSTVYLPCWK